MVGQNVKFQWLPCPDLVTFRHWFFVLLYKLLSSASMKKSYPKKCSSIWLLKPEQIIASLDLDKWHHCREIAGRLLCWWRFLKTLTCRGGEALELSSHSTVRTDFVYGRDTRHTTQVLSSSQYWEVTISRWWSGRQDQPKFMDPPLPAWHQEVGESGRPAYCTIQLHMLSTS